MHQSSGRIGMAEKSKQLQLTKLNGLNLNVAQPPPSTPPTIKLKPNIFSSVFQFLPSHNCDKDFLSTKSASLSFQSMQQLQQQGISCREWSKDVLIVKSWDYCMANWVYVSLFRVRTLSGLYLCKPLALDKSFEVPRKLINFEKRMMEKERLFLQTRRSSTNNGGL
jgi:hypothetical protein